MLENQAGKFVLPTPATVTAAAAGTYSAHATRSAPYLGVRSRAKFLPPDQLRICSGLNQAVESRRLRRPSAISYSGVSRRKAAARQASSTPFTSLGCRRPSVHSVNYRSPKSSRLRAGPSIEGDRYAECQCGHGPAPNRAGLYRRAADVAGRHPAAIQPHDDDAVAHLDACRRRQVLRGVCRVHDRRCAAADRAPIQYHASRRTASSAPRACAES